MTILAASYADARRRNRANGWAHALGVLALPRSVRNDVRAIYGFARTVDDLVDGPLDGDDRRVVFDQLVRRLRADLPTGRSDHPALAAVIDTATRWGLDESCFRRYLRAMEMDLRSQRYDSEEDLLEYLDGAALAPADLVLPLLRPVDLEKARPAAHDLALALHLADLLTDVAKDLDQGRCYLPAREVERHRAASALAQRRATPGWEQLASTIGRRARAHLDESRLGLGLLPARSASYVSCVRAYARARLDALEAVRFDVFGTSGTTALRYHAAELLGALAGGRKRR